MRQLDDILAEHSEQDACPKSPAFRRDLAILIFLTKRRLLKPARRIHGPTR